MAKANEDGFHCSECQTQSSRLWINDGKEGRSVGAAIRKGLETKLERMRKDIAAAAAGTAASSGPWNNDKKGGKLCRSCYEIIR